MMCVRGARRDIDVTVAAVDSTLTLASTQLPAVRSPRTAASAMSSEGARVSPTAAAARGGKKRARSDHASAAAPAVEPLHVGDTFLLRAHVRALAVVAP
jgi:hypothetical protein